MNAGISYPLRTNSRGGIQASSGESKIKESLLLILGTQPGERLMRPNFGCNLRDLVFASNNAATSDIARHRVSEALRVWEPRIVVDDVIVTNDNKDGRLIVEIKYRVKTTDAPQSLQVAVPLG